MNSKSVNRKNSFKMLFFKLLFLYLIPLPIFYFDENNPNFHLSHHFNHVEAIFPNKLPSVTFVFSPILQPNLTIYYELLHLTISSWIESIPNSSIFILASSKEIFNQTKIIDVVSNLTSNYQILTNIEVDEIGLLYLDDMFFKVIEKAKTDMICFIMQDVLIPMKTGKKIQFLYNFYKHQNKQFAAIGKRCIFPFTKLKIDFNEDKVVHDFRMDYLESDPLRIINSIQNEEFSNDLILFSLNNNVLDFSEIPAFHYGMYEWDSWITGWMKKKIPVVSLGSDCSIYHIQRPNMNPFHCLPKIAENLEIGQTHYVKPIFYKDLELHIDGNTLYDEITVIATLL